MIFNSLFLWFSIVEPDNNMNMYKQNTLRSALMLTHTHVPVHVLSSNGCDDVNVVYCVPSDKLTLYKLSIQYSDPFDITSDQ